MTVNDLFELLRAGNLVSREDAYELAERVYVALSASAVSGAADPVASAAGEQPGPVSAAPTREGVGGLPEPAAWQKACAHVTYLRTAALMADTPEEFDGLNRYGWAPLYTADQMQAAIAAERERSAELLQAADHLRARLEAELSALRERHAEAVRDAERYRWLAQHARVTAEHWGGRWSLAIDGPAPARDDDEAAIADAIDAAVARQRADL